MSDAATVAVIRDLFSVAGVALVLALAFYPVLRAGGGPAWNCDGNVMSRTYGWPDAIAALILASFFVSNGIASRESEATSPPAPPPPTPAPGISEGALLIGMISMLVVAFLLLAYMKMRRLEPGEMFGIRQMRPGRALATAGLALIPAYVAVFLMRALADLWFGGQFPDTSLQEPVEAYRAAGGLVFKLLLGATAVFVAPVAEEVIFRGFLYGVTKRFTDRWFAAMFTSLVFACVHHHLGSVVPLFTLAMSFAVAYEATGCLVVPMAMHAMFNGLNLLLINILPGP